MCWLSCCYDALSIFSNRQKMIRLQGISKQFGDKAVLEDIHANFLSGKVNMVIGASGSGKSVLMKIMVGLIKPDAGRLFYKDLDLSEMEGDQRNELRQQIGMLFQSSALFDSLTVKDNLLFPMRMFRPAPKAEMQERVAYCLERVGLAGTENLFPAELSGGMKKRVGIARAIVLQPGFLFCDEPNSGLDPKTSIRIDHLIQDITNEYQITTVVNTHDMNSVLECGDYIIFLYKGRKTWEGDRKLILNSDNGPLNDLVYASRFLHQFRQKES
jgi:phospholipid/cholesterol/gamma-HCH transport system ATP-binding protein